MVKEINCNHDEIQERYCLNCHSILSQEDEIDKLEAENEQLKVEVKRLVDRIENNWIPEFNKSEAELLECIKGDKTMKTHIKYIINNITAKRDQAERLRDGKKQFTDSWHYYNGQLEAFEYARTIVKANLVSMPANVL